MYDFCPCVEITIKSYLNRNRTFYQQIFLLEFMLGSKRIRCLFGQMILFNGKLGYNPNTLNNRVHTYFLSHKWQEENMKEKGKTSDLQFTHQAWMKLILDVSQFNIDYKNVMCVDPRSPGLSLFYDWSVYGDMMLVPEYKAVALVDEDEQVPLKSFKERFPNAEPVLVTNKMGEDKGVMAIIDQDAEDAYKTFSLTLKLGQKHKVRFEPACSRNLSRRTLKANPDEHQGPYLENPTSLQTEWMFGGTPEELFVREATRENSSPEVQKFFQNFVRKGDELQRLFLKEVQYRYNHNTKLSQIKGFVSQTKNQNDSNDINMQGWRTVRLPYKDLKEQEASANPIWGGLVNLKKVKHGVLIDISGAIAEQNDCTTMTPIFPRSTLIQIKSNGKVLISLTKKQACIQDIIQNYAGLVFVPNSQIKAPIPDNSPISAYVQYDAYKYMVTHEGTEKEYMINVKDACVKSDINEDVPLSMSEYLNKANVEVYCSRYGVPYEGKLKVELSTNCPVNSDSIDAYSTNQVKYYDCEKNQYVKTSAGIQNSFDCFINRVNCMSADQKAKYIAAYGDGTNITRQTIIDKVYQGQTKFQHIKDVSDNLISSRIYRNNDHSYQWKKQNQQTTKFQMLFLDKSTSKQIQFKNGRSNIEVCLDTPLTAKNNPRNPQIKSLAVMGILNTPQGQAQVSNKTFFFSIFYETKPDNDKFNDITLADWCTSISPTLKKMGLLYPSMQKIVNLYYFKSISMKAMKRAFDVEDENHPRYMPSTRELSKLEHRQIRKWLYDPHYRISPEARDRKAFIKRKYCPDFQGTVTKQLFKTRKTQLVENLKKAFRVELTTIPLYLTAMYTAPDKATENLLRSVAIDEMKHLFIVSNLLNAVSQGDNSLPYLDQEYLPSYTKGQIKDVLQISSDFDPAYKKYFQSFFIQPCTPDQILKFICIELPGETQINFSTSSQSQQLQERVNKLNGLMKAVTEEKKLKKGFMTIGDFYGTVLDSLWDLADMEEIVNKRDGDRTVRLFSGEPSKQFTYFNLEDMSQIYDLRSALNQIRLIIEEGEGANLFTLEGDINKESHFFKFIEIYTRGQIIIPDDFNLNPISILVEDRPPNQSFSNNFSQSYMQKWAESWTNQNLIASKKKVINKEFCEEASTIAFPTGNQQPQYPDIYSVVGFTNAYEQILEELNLIFNTSFKNFIKNQKRGILKEKVFKYAQLKTGHEVSELLDNPQIIFNSSLKSEIKAEGKNILKDLVAQIVELKTEYEVWRRKRMENAIAKMRQMTLHSERVIHPSYAKNPVLDTDNNIGMGPDYEVNLKQTTSFKCPGSQSKKR